MIDTHKTFLKQINDSRNTYLIVSHNNLKNHSYKGLHYDISNSL
uniref:Uncharacterized protein n=1 Tax=Anguilla anguilla TaxID=7936 RepID=A0A0E9Q684_ANGAN